MLWNGTVFLAVPQDAGTLAATSPDGITWTSRTLSASQSFLSGAWNGSAFCLFGASSNTAVTSPDGVVWTTRQLTTTASWRGAAAAHLQFGTF